MSSLRCFEIAFIFSFCFWLSDAANEVDNNPMQPHLKSAHCKSMDTDSMAKSVPQKEILEALINDKAGMKRCNFQHSRVQGEHLASFVQARPRIRTVFQIGGFCKGLYSSLSLAMALPSDAEITVIDFVKQLCPTAIQHTKRAGIAEKIVKHGLTSHESCSLDALIAKEKSTGQLFDLSFIHATDKNHYLSYVEQVIPMLKTGGFLILDVTVWPTDDRKHGHDNSIGSIVFKLAKEMRLKPYPVNTDGTLLVYEKTY